MSHIKFIDAALDRYEPAIVDIFRPRWEKTAGMSIYMPAEIEQFMKTAKPVEGKRLLLVHGLGSEESWGFNRNGDGFSEKWDGVDNLLEKDASKGYGYKTFEKNAHTFRDHRNHDPKLSIGGKVVLAAWNDKMHRVELIIPVSESLAPDLTDAIDHGEKIAVSMGAKVPFDVCGKCGNKAKHRGEYCKHARDMMNHIEEDGTKYGVHNPRPNFFDISCLGDRGTGRPADPSAFSLAKVASVQNKWAGEKKSDIVKEVPAVAEDAEKASQQSHELKALLSNAKHAMPLDMMKRASMPVSVIQSLKLAGDRASIATLTAYGILLSPDEFNKLGWTTVPAKIDLSDFSEKVARVVEPELPNASMWLSYFGDRCYRHHVKQASSVEQRVLPELAPAYRAYVDSVKNLLMEPYATNKLAELYGRKASLTAEMLRSDDLSVVKYANPNRGLSAQNLVASILGPMVLGAYFRSKQQNDPWSVGPVQGFVADHPMMTGAATALLWHKLKGGTIPGLG